MRKQNGFTLIELLVVIAIIALLMEFGDRASNQRLRGTQRSRRARKLHIMPLIRNHSSSQNCG